MSYKITGSSIAKQKATLHVKKSNIDFGTVPADADMLPSPAELFLSSFAACVLKNVERFSSILKFTYTKATIEVEAIRLENPPRMNELSYTLVIYSDDDRLKPDLLKKNIEKYGTIYNTVKLSCTVNGSLEVVKSI